VTGAWIPRRSARSTAAVVAAGLVACSPRTARHRAADGSQGSRSRPAPEAASAGRPMAPEPSSAPAGTGAARPVPGRSRTAAPPPSATCGAFARTYCGRVEACTPGLLLADHGDVATCVERWASWCARTESLAGSGLSDETVRDCEEALAAVECRRFRALDDLPLPVCHPMGQLPRGAACLEHVQCQTGLCLRDPSRQDTSCGTCEPRAPSNGDCFMGHSGPREGCPLGEACSRGRCIGPLKDVGEPCGLGSPWSSDCYGDSMFGRGDAECRGTPPSTGALGVCQRDPDFSPCSDRGGPCPPGAGEGAACGQEVACAFPLVCAAGVCGPIDPACR
jgi:hypothetical protein